MKPFHLSFLAASGVALLLGGDGPSRGAGAMAAGAGRVAAATSQVLNLDPATGAFIAAPPSTMQPFDANALSTSDEGLVTEASPVRGGGYMVDLQGRFQSTVVAVIDSSGVLHAECVSRPTTGKVK